MPIWKQILTLCAVSTGGAVAMGLWNGLPAPPESVQAEVIACGAGDEAEEGIRWISQAEARALVGDAAVAFVDCRPRPHFVAGHVMGSLNVPAGDAVLEDRVVELLRGAQTVITYCDADSQCERSLRLASIFIASGLPDVRVLEGGLPAWLDNGYPAESGTCRLCPN